VCAWNLTGFYWAFVVVLILARPDVDSTPHLTGPDTFVFEAAFGIGQAVKPRGSLALALSRGVCLVLLSVARWFFLLLFWRIAPPRAASANGGRAKGVSSGVFICALVRCIPLDARVALSSLWLCVDSLSPQPDESRYFHVRRSEFEKKLLLRREWKAVPPFHSTTVSHLVALFVKAAQRVSR
jgi:hypothetical protein